MRLQTEWDAALRSGDPLRFPGYVPPEEESVRTGRTDHYALIEGRFDVLGGSMGAAHGERVVRAYRRARDARLPVVIVTTSGGARMQEGMISLIQMARTAGAAHDHASAGLLQVAVLRGPTTGGVYASYASLADVRAAEPGATIGFAGPRVVELTTGERLGDDSHTAEAALAHGLVDTLVPHGDQLAFVERALGLREGGFTTAFAWPVEFPRAASDSGWDQTLAARDDRRPSGDAWAATLSSAWTPLHSADPGLRAAIATCAGHRCVVVALNRGRPGPTGYRLAQRAIALADRVGLPLVTFIDTPGADPSPAAEAGGIAGEIARTFRALDALRSPSVAVCVGEGGSGGAFALAHCDRLLMLEGATFSVIAPEGAAAILDRDAAHAPVRAEQLKLTAPDLLRLGIADEVIRTERDAVAHAIARSLADATVGDRRRRLDRATERWVR